MRVVSSPLSVLRALRGLLPWQDSLLMRVTVHWVRVGMVYKYGNSSLFILKIKLRKENSERSENVNLKLLAFVYPTLTVSSQV